MSKIPFTLPSSNLYHAALTGNMELAQESVAEGANVNYEEINRTVLQVAVATNKMDIVEYLLQQGANPNLKSSDTMTPLMFAESGEMVKLLAKYGADYKMTDGSRNNALRYFIEWDCLDAVMAWLQLGWPVIRKTKRLMDRLLTKFQFDMITLLTGYNFEAEHPLARAAEFKVRWVA